MTNKKLPMKTLAPDPVLEQLTRRQLLKTGVSIVAHASAGAILNALSSSTSFGAESSAKSYPPQRRLIWIQLRGGWDILESVDPKESSTSGIDMAYEWSDAQPILGLNGDHRIGRWLPLTAGIGNDLLVIRGLAMGTTSHTAGSIYMETGILSNTGRVNAATIPTIVASESGATIPIIQLGGGSDIMTDRGLLKTVSAVRASNLGLYQKMYPQNASEKADKLALLDYLKSSATRRMQEAGNNDRLQELSAAESKIRLQVESNVGGALQVSPSDLSPFASEGQKGMGGDMSNSFALANKLIKSNVATCVNLGLGGFDTHAGQSARLQPILTQLDFLLSRLVRELRASGDLDTTLIVLYSDFGRTPKINGSNGRDHWPVGGAMFIGGGISGARVVGATNSNLLAESIDLDSGNVHSGGQQLNPTHIGGSVLSLTLGSDYLKYRPYLSAPNSLIRLKK